MLSMYTQVIISATSQKEADEISKVLLKRKLVAGTLVLKGPSTYWWKGRIVKRQYYNVQAFTTLDKKRKIISAVKRMHVDKTPIIAFLRIDGNVEFLRWIKTSIKRP